MSIESNECFFSFVHEDICLRLVSFDISIEMHEKNYICRGPRFLKKLSSVSVEK